VKLKFLLSNKPVNRFYIYKEIKILYSLKNQEKKVL